MKILPNGVAVCGKGWHEEWCRTGLIHDRWMADIICAHLKPGDIAINGGAHIGTLCRPMLDAGAIVSAFEPNPEAVECLRHNCPEAKIYAVGLTDEEGFRLFHKQENAGGSYLTGQPLKESFEGGLLCIALDEFRPLRGANVRVIVMDIEGFETQALRGAREMIERCRPVLIMEVNDGALRRVGSSKEELLALIRGWGYTERILQQENGYGSPCFDIEAVPQ